MKQYLPVPLRPASLILSDHCPILQRPRLLLGEAGRKHAGASKLDAIRRQCVIDRGLISIRI
jgi:hypothetical protein